MWGLISYPHIISYSFTSIDKISQKRLKGIIKGIIKGYKKDKAPVDNFSNPKSFSPRLRRGLAPPLGGCARPRPPMAARGQKQQAFDRLETT